MMMVTRKLNQVRNSFYVYLPRAWCDKFGLDKNSEVKIKETPEGLLTVLPPDYEAKIGGILKVLMEDVGKDRVESVLTGAYIVGANSIQIGFSKTMDMETRERISRWIRRLPGFEVLDEHSDKLDISDTSEKQVIIPILKRQFSTTKYMLNVLIGATETGDLEDSRRLEDRDEDVDRHRYFVERLCHLALQDSSYARKIEISPSDCLHFSLAAKYVERIADHICGAAAQLEEAGELPDDIKKACIEMGQVYEEMMQAFFSVESYKGKTPGIYDEGHEAFEVLEKANIMVERFAKYESASKRAKPAHVLLVMHFGRIASYCADIGEVGINRIVGSHISG